jgi:hypothetical protein
MKKVVFGLLALMLVASPGWAAGLTLTIRDGRVSLDAQDVTIRQILTEWARVGKTRIVNLERVTSGPMTLKFDGVSEEQALDIILRTVPGYMAAPRAAMVADASRYDRILIMPTTTAVAARPSSSPAPVPQPSPNVTQLRGMPPLGMLPGTDGGDEMNDPALAAAAAAGLIAVPGQAPMPGDRTPRPPFGAPFMPPQPQSQVPPASTAPTPVWTAPTGTARPGPLVPTQTLPTQTLPTRPPSVAPPQADQ